MIKRLAVIFSLFLFMPSPVMAEALKIAVFPMEDMSQGHNGVNHEITKYICADLQQRGFEVIDQETVIDFMAKNRVRWLGYLDTRHIVMSRQELGADLVLFGTVSLKTEDYTPTLGLTLNLVRTADTFTLWTGSEGLSQADMLKLLGINEPEDDELMPILASRVMEKWPEILDMEANQLPPLEIEEVALGPKYTRSGDQISCAVKLRSDFEEEDQPRVFFRSAGRVHLAKLNPETRRYESSWLISDNEGRYPVLMVINWPKGRKKTAFLGVYNVDNSPPTLALEMKGVRLEGTVAFRDKVIILPRMVRREPVSRWKLVVQNTAGEEQVSYSGYGQLPRRFVWNGKSKGGWLAAEGIYHVALQAWDRADNMAITGQQVAVARTPPAMVLEAKNRGRDMIVDLSHEGKVPIAFWRMEMRDENGNVIKVAEGENLPYQMDLPFEQKQEKRRVKCSVTSKEILGNESHETIDDLMFMALGGKERSESPDPNATKAWIEEF